MSDPMNRPDRTPEESLPRKSASPLLWILVLLVLLALMWYFMSRRDAVEPPAPPVTPIGDATPVPSQSPVSNPPARRETAARRQPQRPSAPADREARVLQQAAPDYPAVALRAREEGTVLVRAEIGADGKPGNVELAKRSGSRDLDRAALAAVRTWTFEPAIRDGKPVASTVQVPVDFRLDTQ